MRWVIGLAKSVCAAFAIAFISLGTGVSAQAATYNWSFDCQAAISSCIGSGTLETSPAIGPALLTGIQGKWGGATITGPITPGGYFGNDNLILALTPTTALTFNGIAFTAGGSSVNLFYSGGEYNFIDSSAAIGTGTFTVSETPIPAALPLLASGLAVLVLFGWHRKREAVAKLAGA